MAVEEPRSGARAVDRAIAVLACFESNDPELSVSELAQLAGLPVSTTHRLAQALVRGKLLQQDVATDRYRIGAGLVSLARPALSRFELDSAAPHLFALAAGIRITVSVSTVADRQVHTVFQARPPIWFCEHQIPAPRQPLRSSAAGQALLAFSAAHTVAEELAGRASGAPDGLHADLDRVRRNGFAVTEIDAADPIRCLAVPIAGAGNRVHGALAVQARSRRLTDELVNRIVPSMRRIAHRVGPLLDTPAAASE
ncbi:IclR family transcriptional regulator [Nocardia stercoris]|uniref:IclR family transcriptional regulator n=1 Tax=Nocardia stercoris TaxID=2483361 RepID=A0A3M2L755_9NOCA|nr:helix-turn-helix domain-containing protein [Nocardia stercoris]RMI30368.1 IclR family transcriptional regulator [Nocardia stercoris]